MVADDHIDSFGLGIFHFLISLDAAVESDDQPETAVTRPVYSLVRQAVTLIVTVRNVEIHLLGISPEEGIHQRHGCGAVHVIIPVNQNLFLGGDGLTNPLDRRVHVLHQERVMEIVKAGAEERAGLLEGLNSPFDKQFGQDTVNAQLGGKPSHLLRISRFLDYPLALFSHIKQI